MCDRQQDGAVVLLGDPIVDVVCRTTEAKLQIVGLSPGGCCPVDAVEMRSLMERFELTERHQRCSLRSACSRLSLLAGLTRPALSTG